MAPRGALGARALLLVLVVTGALAPSHARAAHPNGIRLCTKEFSHGQDRFVNLATDAIHDRQGHRVGRLSLNINPEGDGDDFYMRICAVTIRRTHKRPRFTGVRIKRVRRRPQVAPGRQPRLPLLRGARRPADIPGPGGEGAGNNQEGPLQVLGPLDPDGVPTQKPHALSGSAPPR
jgi:hypothetical protein